MRIFVKAKPNAHHDAVTKLSDTSYQVAVTALPVKGLANEAIAKVLAEHFGVPRSQVRLVSGFTSRQKVFEILGV